MNRIAIWIMMHVHASAFYWRGPGGSHLGLANSGKKGISPQITPMSADSRRNHLRNLRQKTLGVHGDLGGSVSSCLLVANPQSDGYHWLMVSGQDRQGFFAADDADGRRFSIRHGEHGVGHEKAQRGLRPQPNTF